MRCHSSKETDREAGEVGQNRQEHCALGKTEGETLGLRAPAGWSVSVKEQAEGKEEGSLGSSPGLGRSHMPLSSWAREPQLLSLRVWSLCSATREAAIVRGPRIAMKSGPHLPQLEKALAQKRRPNTAKN